MGRPHQRERVLCDRADASGSTVSPGLMKHGIADKKKTPIKDFFAYLVSGKHNFNPII